MDRQLNVWINHTLIGTLSEQNGLWSFAYTQQWLRQPGAYPLCPNLPLQNEPHMDGASVRPVQWYFDNL
ncbi:MAG: HipA N-terminal domain-containing protein, partial [Pseudomonadaceae bacterium]